ncbi:MAG: hypothetical protein IKG69_08510 [Atopobiaceae bacterium]|nr:hypothetical protein [Atopobiaceae bacterium]
MGGRGSSSGGNAKEYRGIAIQRSDGRQRWKATIDGETYGFNTPAEARSYIDAALRPENAEGMARIMAANEAASGERARAAEESRQRAASEYSRREREQARSTLASLKAPKRGDGTSIRVGDREVYISRGTPGWTPSSWYDRSSLRKSQYTVRTTIGGAYGNTEFFDGPDGWKRAKRYAASYLGVEG